MTAAAVPTTHLLYLHGFRSSPSSAKAVRMAQWVQTHRPDLQWLCPQLPPSPRDAIDGLLAQTADWPAESSAVVGSSLGGFYASVIAEQRGWRAVLLNPAVDPATSLAKHLGEQTQWHSPQERFFFRPEFIDEFRAMTPAAITRLDRYFAVIAKGDEVLDWRQMTARYAGAHIKLLEGGDHALSDFNEHLPDLLENLRLV